MEAFIEGVRCQPCLWNPLHPDYREAQVKDEAWLRVVDQYNDSSIPNIQAAKTEWKKLRDNHRDALKRAKLGKNKLLPAQITTWKYAKAMQFLEPHMKYRITENIELDPLTASSFKHSEPDVSTTENTEIYVSPSKRRCITLERKRESNDHHPVSIETKTKSEPDALESFFNCIQQSTREMPQWMQTQVKKKMFAVIIEAEEYLAQDHNPRNYDNSVIFETKIKTEVFTDDD